MINSFGVIPYSYKDNKLYILLVQRRDSFAFIDFMLGRSIKVEGMTTDEHHRILKYNFHRLFEDMSLDRRCTKEQYHSYSNFFHTHIDDVREKIINDKSGNLKTSLWGFPKGRPSYNETPKETAKREFYEETGLQCGELGNKRIKHSYTGDNGKAYTAYFYPCHFEKMLIPQQKTVNKGIRRTMISTETQDVKWLQYEEALENIDSQKAKVLEMFKKSIKNF